MIAPFCLANSNALITLDEFPLPLNAKTTSFSLRKFFNCSINTSSNVTSLAQAEFTAKLSTNEIAENLFSSFVIVVLRRQ